MGYIPNEQIEFVDNIRKVIQFQKEKQKVALGGPSGLSGPSGLIGPSGVNGLSGLSGPSGLGGPSSLSGPSGLSVPGGLRGPIGNQVHQPQNTGGSMMGLGHAVMGQGQVYATGPLTSQIINNIFMNGASSGAYGK